MNPLSIVFAFKIAATVIFWCIPLIFLPVSVLQSIGFPKLESYMFVRMLGWAYFALCVGYWFGLKASLNNQRAIATIWVGIFSNAGGFFYLLFYAVSGTWSTWGGVIQFIGWSSILATLLITLGLIQFGVQGHGEVV